MLNQVVLVGTIKKYNNNKQTVTIKANQETVLCHLPPTLYSNLKDYGKIGKTIGIKGKLSTESSRLKLTVDKLTIIGDNNENIR